MKLYIRDKLDPKVGDILVCYYGNIPVTAVYKDLFIAGERIHDKQWITRRCRANDAYIIRDCKMVIVYMTYPCYIKQS
jgi:uncharacterized protein YifN (PemK superfamily)